MASRIATGHGAMKLTLLNDVMSVSGRVMVDAFVVDDVVCVMHKDASSSKWHAKSINVMRLLMQHEILLTGGVLSVQHGSKCLSADVVRCQESSCWCDARRLIYRGPGQRVPNLVVRAETKRLRARGWQQSSRHGRQREEALVAGRKAGQEGRAGLVGEATTCSNVTELAPRTLKVTCQETSLVK